MAVEVLPAPPSSQHSSNAFYLSPIESLWKQVWRREVTKFQPLHHRTKAGLRVGLGSLLTKE